jgi:hypothetical protein
MRSLAGMKVQLPLGDVVDKVTILLLKRKHMADAAKQSNVSRELEVLRAAWAVEGLEPMHSLAAWDGLCEVNAKLWQVEDELREHEAERDFGAKFVALARSVYKLNDQRATLKRAINVALGSELVEEKSYKDYQ